MNLLTPLPHLDHERVQAAIAAAELQTSAEIRVVISRAAIDDPIAEAQRQFHRLGMDATAARNGVLILVAPRSHTFAVIGDQAVHAHCGDVFWRGLTDAMGDAFRRNDFTAGLVLGIERAGELLAQHFPRHPEDRNELPDAVDVV